MDFFAAPLYALLTAFAGWDQAIPIRTIQVAITIGSFVIGVLTFLTGVGILVFGTVRSDVKEVTKQTTKLAQKGLAEELSGLVGNASTLLTTMNDMVRTNNGTGIFLTILGLLLMLGSGWLAFQLQ